MEVEGHESISEAQNGVDGASASGEAAVQRRVVGPAMPPPELLAAAAEAKQAVRPVSFLCSAVSFSIGIFSCRKLSVGRACGCIRKIHAAQMEDELDGEDDDLIGPAPPELVHELENAGSDERSKEVIRVLRCCLAHRTPATDQHVLQQTSSRIWAFMQQ